MDGRCNQCKAITEIYKAKVWLNPQQVPGIHQSYLYEKKGWLNQV